jgi:hypothetical protein
MLSNPPYSKSWKTDLERMGGKDGIKDPRFAMLAVWFFVLLRSLPWAYFEADRGWRKTVDFRRLFSPGRPSVLAGFSIWSRENRALTPTAYF